ncbi:ankyrin repeat protein [Pandoravirus inopinatum]|uniref:Ankyrin repeat protein n=1 Tax=Pandoravirus inopinatum TaxID=1605721 RepID=A0A0B5IY64_9VIRU|nr:ankyrin repeat protein [Pandoravirus inopinatum]AJF97763.1 ankyrin repeat protein [Pandoravirus inopinatum]
MWATLDVELCALVMDHVDSLARPVMPFVCRRLRDATRYHRLVRPRPVTDIPAKPLFAQQHDYVEALIAAKLPHLVRWAVDEAGCEMPQGTCRKIAATGDLALLKWARVDKRAPWDQRTCEAAVNARSLDVLCWAVENGCPWDRHQIIVTAAETGTADILAWCLDSNVDEPAKSRRTIETYSIWSTACLDVIRARGLVLHRSLSYVAASRGHIDVLAWLHNNKRQAWDVAHCSNAASAQSDSDENETLRWLIGVGCPYDAETVWKLAARGRLGTLQWLHGIGNRGEPIVSDDAIGDGKPTNVHRIDVNRCMWHEVARAAASGGHLDVIQWAKDVGHPWRDGICDAAARGCHLNVLSWAYDEHGCAWSDRSKAKACKRAVRRGDLELIKWLVDRGCPLDVDAMVRDAMEHDRLDILDWLHNRGVGWSRQRFVCLYAGLISRRLDVILWLHARGVPLDVDMCTAAAVAGRMDVLRWAVDNGCVFTPGACEAVARTGNLQMLMWLRSHGCPWDEATCDNGVAHLDVLRWARAQGCPWSGHIHTWTDDVDPEVIEWLNAQDDVPPRPEPDPVVQRYLASWH